VSQSFTTEQERHYKRARNWATGELVPFAPADTFARWYAFLGHELFLLDDLESAWLWWTQLPEAQRNGQDDS